MSEKILKQSFWQKTKRFFEPVKENKGVTILLLLYFGLELLIGVLFIFFIRDITFALEQGSKDIFYSVLWSYIIYFIIAFISVFCAKNWWTYDYNRYRETIEDQYMPLYVTLDSNSHERIGTGKSVAIISKGIKMWGGLIGNTLIEILKVLVSFSVTVYFLFQIHLSLAFLMFILFVLGQAIGFYTNILVSNIRQHRLELDNLWSKRLVKIIMAKMEILQTRRIHNEIDVLRELHEGQIYYNKKMATFLVPFFSIGNMIVLIILLTIFFSFGELYFSGEITLSTIAALTGAILMMQKDFIGLLDFLKGFGRDFAEIQNMWNFFDTTPQIQGYEHGDTFQHKDGQIELKDISYSYDDSKTVFQNFSLDIPGSRVTAFVGPSGGGKSTLVKLIAGYIRPDAGNIEVDTQNLQDVSLKSYYKDVGYLTQEPSVFDGTIRENLLYAVGEDIDETQIEKIIKLAHCDFIYDLSDGLDTEIGERGVKLSGGQKQRLAIAKIFLKDPKIIILDEPTSALDSVSEQKITRAMHNLFKNRTVLVIAHRLQTVKHADDIVVIQGGEMIERGTHSELVKQKGFYKQMLDLQSGF